MATLAALRTKIAEVIQDPSFQSISVASVDALINDAIAFYKHDQFWFNETSADLVLTVANPDLSGIPSDFFRELTHGALTIKFSNMFFSLDKVSTEAYDSRNISMLGLPNAYVYRAGQFEVYPFPNVAYAIKLRYLKDYDVLAGDSSSNDFTNYLERVIRFDALSRFYVEYKQDEKMAKFYADGASSELEQVRKRSNARAGSGSIVMHSALLET